MFWWIPMAVTAVVVLAFAASMALEKDWQSAYGGVMFTTAVLVVGIAARVLP